ncbi:hypothetical protein ScPMuIL_004527 [Solemya velum]
MVKKTQVRGVNVNEHSSNDSSLFVHRYRIGPFEVESALMEHPAVVESAAVSSPDKIRGEVVKSFITLSQEYKDADKDALIAELQNYVKKITAPYKYPRKIEFVEELPKTISGKIRRVELREREWRQTGRGDNCSDSDTD